MNACGQGQSQVQGLRLQTLPMSPGALRGSDPSRTQHRREELQLGTLGGQASLNRTWSWSLPQVAVSHSLSLNCRSGPRRMTPKCPNLPTHPATPSPTQDPYALGSISQVGRQRWGGEEGRPGPGAQRIPHHSSLRPQGKQTLHLRGCQSPRKGGNTQIPGALPAWCQMSSRRCFFGG